MDEKVTTQENKEAVLTEEITERFSIENNAFVSKEESEQKPVEVEIGDTKQAEFLPQVKVKKWGNEVNFSARLITDQSITDIVTEGNKVKLIQENQEVHLYEKEMDLTDEFALDVTVEDTKGHLSFNVEDFESIKVGKQIIGRDSVEERDIRALDAKNLFGDVLIVGLGLGVINEYLGHVKSVTVVESRQEVIDYVKKKYPERVRGVTIICAEFYKFSTKTTLKFDSIYGDIFPFTRRGDILKWKRFFDAASPLLRLNGVVDGRIRQMYETMIQTPVVEQGMEFEVILNEAPKSNVFEFSIQTKGVKFYYQPELSPEEIADGCFRPASAIGSYAVYNEDSRNGNEYKSGKVGHIWRPKIIDANGEWAWGTVHIDEEKGILSIVVPQDFLDKKVYPMIVDPTIGYAVSGASNESGGGGIIYILQSSNITGATDDGMFAIRMGWFLAAGSNGSGVPAKMMLYDSSNVPITNGVTEERRSYSGGDNNKFRFLSGTPLSIPPSTTYKLCLWAASSKLNHQIRYDVTSLGDGASQTLAYGTPPNPLVPVDSTRKYSMYLDYIGAYGKFPLPKSLRPRPFRPGLAR